jgi:hypothetical protein
MTIVRALHLDLAELTEDDTAEKDETNDVPLLLW